MIEIDEYVAAFPGAKAGEKIVDMELNYIILNSIRNGWSRQTYLQGFDREYITLKKL